VLTWRLHAWRPYCPWQGFLAERGHTNEDLLEAVKAEQAKNPDGVLGMDTVGVILATLEYDVFLQVQSQTGQRSDMLPYLLTVTD